MPVKATGIVIAGTRMQAQVIRLVQVAPINTASIFSIVSRGVLLLAIFVPNASAYSWRSA